MSKRMGPVQRRIFTRAGRSGQGYVMPSGYLERRACKRLERRGLLFPRLGISDAWSLS